MPRACIDGEEDKKQSYWGKSQPEKLNKKGEKRPG